MNAQPAQQQSLLDLAELDARILRADAARNNPPQAARVRELVAQRTQLTVELTARQGLRDDLNAELARIESDVKVVDARRQRDTQRLDEASSMKNAQGLESELASLARRKNELEDAQLDIMERLEDAETAVAEQQARIDDVNADGARLSAEGKAAVAAATADHEAGVRDRDTLAGRLPADLLALYERLRQRSVGAALLRRQTCEGCRMVLSGSDLREIGQASAEAVVTCPECGCILVRTDESGL